MSGSGVTLPVCRMRPGLFYRDLALLVLAFAQIGPQRFSEAAGAFGIILAHFLSIWRDVLDPSIAFVHRRASLRSPVVPGRPFNGHAAVAQW